MQKSYFLPDNISTHIHRPACPKCRAFMMLARIALRANDHETSESEEFSLGA